MPDPASTKKKSIKGAAGASTDQKQRREQALVKLRKEKREEGLLKKRNTNVAEEVPAQNAGASSSAAPAVTEVKLEHLQSYCVGEFSRTRRMPVHAEQSATRVTCCYDYF